MDQHKKPASKPAGSNDSKSTCDNANYGIVNDHRRPVYDPKTGTTYWQWGDYSK